MTISLLRHISTCRFLKKKQSSWQSNSTFLSSVLLLYKELLSFMECSEVCGTRTLILHNYVYRKNFFYINGGFSNALGLARPLQLRKLTSKQETWENSFFNENL